MNTSIPSGVRFEAVRNLPSLDIDDLAALVLAFVEEHLPADHAPRLFLVTDAPDRS